MGFYIEDLDDVREPEPVEDGMYELEIVAATFTVGERERINLQVAILNPPEDNPNPPFLRPALFLPAKGQEQWQVDGSKLAMKRCITMFGIDAPGRELTDDETAEWVDTWRGKRAKGKVKKVYNEKMERWENALVMTPLPRAEASKPAGSGGKKSGGLRTV